MQKYELISVSRFDAKDQKTMQWFDDMAEARAFMDAQKQTEPLRYFCIFAHLSTFCRLLTWHTL